jgi:hypothetical protein
MPVNEEVTMSQPTRVKWLVLSIPFAALCALLLLIAAWSGPVSAVGLTDSSIAAPAATEDYVVLAWNDLGMHCYNRDFTDLGVLPPFNTLWAQVIRIGDPPQVVTQGLRVEFFFEDNTYSVGKSNFWDTSPYRPVRNADWLFDRLPAFSAPFPQDVGLLGVGLSGTMQAHGNYFEALGIPLTEFSDSNPNTPYPYQIATVIVYDASTDAELARTQPVAPVSTEMHCDYCHSDNGEGNEDIATGVVEQNILMKHDQENLGEDEYPPGFGPLMDNRPVLCAWCHSSNALLAPGQPGIPSLSNAMHEKHDGTVPDTLAGCYSCHPGPQTQCLRDVMSTFTEHKLYCIDCHGTMLQVSHNPNPWLIEPRCDDTRCHGSAYQQDKALYRMSKDHGDVYCAGCHDSPHAIAPSREANDALKFIGWQGGNGPLRKCTVCHATWPEGEGPHGLTAPPRQHLYLPLILRNWSQ